MKKQIILHCDNEFYYKMREDKVKKEKELDKTLSWENYVKILFGIKGGAK